MHLTANCIDPLLHCHTFQRDVFHAQHNFICGIGGEKLAAGILKYAADHGAELMYRHFQRIFAIKRVAALQLPRVKGGTKPIEDAGKRCFAATAFPGEDDQFSLFHMKVYIAELPHRFVCVFIGKGKVLQFYQKIPLLSNRNTITGISKATTQSAASLHAKRTGR